ncbi:MAG: hypothetical protein WBE76_03040, partial [Terracidiphilus sp.]
MTRKKEGLFAPHRTSHFLARRRFGWASNFRHALGAIAGPGAGNTRRRGTSCRTFGSSTPAVGNA